MKYLILVIMLFSCEIAEIESTIDTVEFNIRSDKGIKFRDVSISLGEYEYKLTMQSKYIDYTYEIEPGYYYCLVWIDINENQVFDRGDLYFDDNIDINESLSLYIGSWSSYF